jgi:hypothetical protein
VSVAYEQFHGIGRLVDLSMVEMCIGPVHFVHCHRNLP